MGILIYWQSALAVMSSAISKDHCTYKSTFVPIKVLPGLYLPVLTLDAQRQISIPVLVDTVTLPVCNARMVHVGIKTFMECQTWWARYDRRREGGINKIPGKELEESWGKSRLFVTGD